MRVSCILLLPKMLWGSHRWKAQVLQGSFTWVPLCLVVWLGAAFAAPISAPVAISSPKVYVHCRQEGGEIAFVLRWEYYFGYSSGRVSGFHIYRRVEGGDYSLLRTVDRSGEGASISVNRDAAGRYVYRYSDKNVQPGKKYWYKVAAFDPAGNEASNEAGIRSDPAGDPVAGAANVLVVVNRSSGESVEIAEYYQRRRGVPGQNILYIPYQGDSGIVSMETFEKNIKLPIREYLASGGLKEKILCILMTYGLPYKIAVRKGRGADSVDAYLTDLFDEYRNDPNYVMVPGGGRYRNPYFAAGSHFSRANGNRGYLVTRLDGPLAKPGDAHYNRDTAHRGDQLQYLKNMIDSAIWAERNAGGPSGKGYFDRRFKAPWASPQGKGDLFINGAYDCCVGERFESFLDTNPQLLGAPPTNSGGKDRLFCDKALWYAGWYSHFYRDVFDWAKGAIGFHIESSTAQNIRTESRYGGGTGWLWVPGMIRAGITATMGPVHEPGLEGVPYINWFFRYFFHGFSFAEAAYMASYSSAGQMVMIGDPLYNPFRAKRLDQKPPLITVTSPGPGEAIRGTKVVVEGTLDDPSISMLDNCRPVLKGRFRYSQGIGSFEADRARLPVIVTATDTSGNTSTATVTVNWANTPPHLEAIQPMEISEGEVLTFRLKGSDPDDDELSYYFDGDSARPRAASLNDRTGQFNWKPDFDQAGTYEFAFRVTDGFASDVKSVTVSVRQAGSHPPKFVSPPKKAVGKAGGMIYLELNAEDLDGDVVVFSGADSLPRGAAIVHDRPKHAVFLWKPSPEQVGIHKIVLAVTDGKGGRDTAPLEIQVVPAEPDRR